MKQNNIRYQYVKPGTVEFYVEIQGTKIILHTARFNDFKDIIRLQHLAVEKLTELNSALHRVAA